MVAEKTSKGEESDDERKAKRMTIPPRLIGDVRGHGGGGVIAGTKRDQNSL